MSKHLNEIISFNSEFKNAINLYLNLNKADKVNGYIPTKSSVDILQQYLSAVEDNKRQATLLIGPYGKGKSHLLLVLLAILSIERNKDNNKLISDLSKRIGKVEKTVADRIDNIWKEKGKFLPIIIMSTQGDLNQAFLVGLNEALKREGLTELAPETYFTHAISVINRWEKDYPETYAEYVNLIKDKKIACRDMLAGLMNCDNSMLDVFKELYPELSAGGVFNPLASSEVLPMYKSIADKLKEQCGYSGIYIIFDEFSKFIDGQDKQAIGNNMKLLQDVCELANDLKEAQVFITMVAHKSIKEYGKYLSTETINSFTGIEGRIEEILFVTSSKNNYELIQNAIYKNEENLINIPEVKRYVNEEAIEKYFEVATFPTVFTKKDFAEIVVRGCYPLSPTSAYLLLNVSEKVAQNERTLFTFISKEEQYSMAKYVKEHPCKNGTEWIINADLIYDYFKNLFKKDVTNEYVHNEWLNAEYALTITNEYNQVKMLKTLAIINVVNKPDELPANIKHLTLAAGVPDAVATIEQLVNDGIIYKKGSNDCYVFKTRATSELKTEIRKRRDIKGDNANIGMVLSQIADIKYILPKKYNQEFTMTRYFRYEFMEVEDFLSLNDSKTFFSDGQFCDGKVIALFSRNEEDYTDAIGEKMQLYKNDRLVVVYSNNKFQLLEQTQDFEIIQELKRDVQFFGIEENKVLIKELPIIEEDLERELIRYVDESFSDKSKKVTFYYKEHSLVSTEKERLTDIVDKICYEVYSKAISINNELINKENITTPPIKKVRKIIIEALLTKSNTDDYLSGTSAEATIYRALFVGTGIRQERYNRNVEALMTMFDEFILSSSLEKQSMTLLIRKVTSAPMGLRKGVIPIYLAYAISKRNEDIIVYFDKKEVPITTDIILNMCESPEDYYIYISLEDVKKERYITSLCNMFGVQSNSVLTDSRISNILLNMQRWFRALPQVTKNIKKQDEYFDSPILPKSFPKIKEMLQRIDANPYEAIFIDMPKAFLAETDFDKVITELAKLKSKLNTYFDWVADKAVKATIEVFDRKAKLDLHHTLQEWYEKQSDLAKQGLHSVKITGLMSCIAENQSYDDSEVVKKVVRAVTEIYMDSWNDNSIQSYIDTLTEVKCQIESMNDISTIGKLELAFTGADGKPIKRYYDRVDENTGSILRNILNDTLEDFADLSANDKVAILLEMIEKVLG